MSLFHHPTDHDSFAGHDAYLARRHGPRSVGATPGRIVERTHDPFTWSVGNIVRAVLAVLAFAGVLVLAAMEQSQVYTMDTETSRGTANAYFAALQRGDDGAAAELSCAEPPTMLGDGTPDVQQALGGGPPAPPEFVLGEEEPTFLDPEDHVAYHFLVREKVRGWVYVERDAGGPWRVCGLLDVEVWVEDP